ncbi:MAG: energy-coupling factor transporter ATPase [Clostridia bacterium]|nr:energy-coupling factor transporter ATPase [Clostridia bacterium]
MSFINVSNLSFRYRPDSPLVLQDINLSVEKGSYTVILGHNGSGKSTLARLLCGLLSPTEGDIIVDGLNTKDEDTLFDLRKKCGMLFQNPDNQLVAGIVEEDVAFAPENLGVPREEIRRRVDDCLKTMGMEEYARHATAKLSGGQKQRVAIAGVLAMEPDCIIFDEATSMLDPSGREELISAMRRLNRDRGLTILAITHYMNETIDADRVLVVNRGSIVMDGTPREIFSEVESLQKISLSVPQVTELLYLLNRDGFRFPGGVLHVSEAAGLIEDEFKKRGGRKPPLSPPAPPAGEAEPAMELVDVSFVYGEKTEFRKTALDHINLRFPKGEVIGIIGHTGSGKSTLASLLNGLRKPTGGKVLLNGADIWSDPKHMRPIRQKVGLVFQYPEYQLFEETVEKDIAFGPSGMGLPQEEIAMRVREAAGFCGLSEQDLARSPFELSGGQKRRAAIAGIIAMQPEVVVLDEPAAGLDPQGRNAILGGLLEYRKQNHATMLLISHSMEEIAKYADRILVLKNGSVFLYGTVGEVFSRAEELAEASLDLPQITKLFLELKNRGLTDETDVYTVPYGKAKVEGMFHV